MGKLIDNFKVTLTALGLYLTGLLSQAEVTAVQLAEVATETAGEINTLIAGAVAIGLDIVRQAYVKAKE